MYTKKGRNGKIPLFLAAQNGLSGVCSLLIKHNGNVNDKWENVATRL